MCIACATEHNDLFIKNNGTIEYVKTIDELMEAMYISTGINRTILGDAAVTDAAINPPNTWNNPNTNWINY